MRREDKIQEVIENSKEIQYSDQVSILDDNKQSFIELIKEYKKFKNNTNDVRRSYDTYRVPDNKAIPLNMIYMERVMTKLMSNGSRSKNRKMREKSCQTATNTQDNDIEDSDILSLDPS